MAYGPPVPRKPASYSPTFLARIDNQYENAYVGRDCPDRYSGQWEDVIEDQYDRDFSLDQRYQELPRSRPSSHGSTYTRPLPSPPSRNSWEPLAMPALHRGGGYDSVFDDRAPHIRNSQVDDRSARLSFRPLPKSPSQSSVRSIRPLPSPPKESFAPRQSLPLPSPPRRRNSIDGSEEDDCAWSMPQNPFMVQPLKVQRREFTVDNRLPTRRYSIYREEDQAPHVAEGAGSVYTDQYYARHHASRASNDYAEPYGYGYDPHHEFDGHSRHTSHDVAALSIPDPRDQDYHELDEESSQYHESTMGAKQNFPQDLRCNRAERLERQPDDYLGSSLDAYGHYSDGYNHGFEYIGEAAREDIGVRDRPLPSLPPSEGERQIPQTGAATQPMRTSTVRERPPIPLIPHLTRNVTAPSPVTSPTKEQTRTHMKRRSTATSIPEQKENVGDAISERARTISSASFELCPAPWSRREIYRWAQQMDLSTSSEFVTSCSGLFCHFVPTQSSAVCCKIATDILQSFIIAGEVTRASEEVNTLEYVADTAAPGVFPALTGAGCYSLRCHTDVSPYRCYSARCSRTLVSKAQPRTISVSVDVHDWAQYWTLTKENEPLASLSKKEIQRQYQIHEVVYSESDYLKVIAILRDVYQPRLPINSSKDKDLMNLVFGNVPKLVELSQQLESSLRERQASQGPVINSVGDIFLEWIERAGPTYIDYASKMRYADRAIRSQRVTDPHIRDWMTKCEQDIRSNKLDFSSYHGSPTRRMQRYALLLGEVLKQTSPEYPDYATLLAAIDSIKAVCQECDRQVKLAQDKITLMELQDLLIWKVPQKDLALLDPAREVLYSGELQRKSESLTSWQTREVILLDNYLLCINRKDTGRATVSRAPIPVDYLVVEDYFELLYKSSSTKILGGTITHSVPQNESITRRPTHESARQVTVDVSSSPSKSATENIYPFTVRHAGRPDEKMTFYAESSSVRAAWVKAVFEAKARRWTKLCSREPFEATVVTGHAFGRYSMTPNQQPSAAPSNVVDLAASETLKTEVKPITMSRVQCTTIYRQADGAEVFLVGTDDGVYANTTGSWSKLVTLARVTQIAFLEDFGVLTVLADKILIAYTLDDLLHARDVRASRIIRRPPQKLSGSKDVGFFEVGFMKERMLVIYKKRENGNSVFKALEPVVGKKQEKVAFYKKGSGTDFFRDFDQFFIPAECYGMQYLRTTICIKCSRGFEIMSLDSKQPLTIPNLAGTNTTTLRLRIENSKPLGTYRVQEGEFLCCYTECGLFVDKYGSVSRPYTLEWEGRPTHAVLVGNYVLAIGKEFIEVWNVEKRSLRQVITGRDIRLLAHSSAGSHVDMAGRGVMIAMECPGNSSRQLVFEMRLRR